MTYSSGQIIALCRFILASVFLLAIYVDPSQPVAVPQQGYALLGVYALASLALLLLASRNWWLDHRLAGAVHVVDLTMFGAVVFMTEGYTSPFFTFSVFLLLSASIRWTWRETGWTALAVNGLFLAAGLMSELVTPGEVDPQRLMIRSSYLLVLSALFTLFALNRERNLASDRPRALLGSNPDGAGFVELVLEHVRRRTGAGEVLFALREEDEPRSRTWRLDAQGLHGQPNERDELSAMLSFDPGAPYLFDCSNRRLLIGGPQVVRGEMPELLARELALTGSAEGLALPVQSGGIGGTVVVLDVPRLSTDLLSAGTGLVEELSQMAEQAAFNRLAQEAAESRVRTLIARDLHDSVVQFLAGVSFRLEALKRSQNSPTMIQHEITGFQEELAAEQDHLRELIADLRKAARTADKVDLSLRLPHLLERLDHQWGVRHELRCEPGLRVPAWIETELHQMVREAVANAARHGRAKTVSIELGAQGKMLRLRLLDDGSGLPLGADGQKITSRSLAERAANLGGELTVGPGDDTDILITIPLEQRS